ncbi:MAG: response regulator [Verrucomicrobia bacterium]|nr:response regulator [Verrucomicrobiota bacterium]
MNLPPNIPVGSGETILLVEAENLTRLVTTRVLTNLGYSVVDAGTVLEGFEQWQAHEQAVRLVVTDYHFKGPLTGMDLRLKVRARNGKLPVLLLIGSWWEAPTRETFVAASVPLLTKPYTLAQMAIMVRTLMDDGGSGSEQRRIDDRG